MLQEQLERARRMGSHELDVDLHSRPTQQVLFQILDDSTSCEVLCSHAPAGIALPERAHIAALRQIQAQLPEPLPAARGMPVPLRFQALHQRSPPRASRSQPACPVWVGAAQNFANAGA